MLKLKSSPTAARPATCYLPEHTPKAVTLAFNMNPDFTLATFAEERELICELNRQFGKNIGYYPPIKSPAWHKPQAEDIRVIVLTKLRQYGLDDAVKASMCNVSILPKSGACPMNWALS